MNRIAGVVESIFGRNLFSFSIGAFNPEEIPNSEFTVGIWDISTNEFLLNQNILDLMPRVPTEKLLDIYTKFLPTIQNIKFDTAGNLDVNHTDFVSNIPSGVLSKLISPLCLRH
jgi:hypothetical protein